jgi:diguanylate cyclase (GGDEF)-like protein
MLLRSLTSRIDGQQRSQDAAPFAVLFVDLNNFKMVNDRLGHEAGDRVLVEVATRLNEATRPGDLVARFAGDEFVLMITELSSREAAEQVRLKLEAVLSEPSQLIDLGGAELAGLFGGAIGLAMYPADGDCADDLIKHADQDMYERKRQSHLKSAS